MDNDIIRKNLEYQQDVEQIAKMLFHAFYYDEEEFITAMVSNDKNHPLTCVEVCQTAIELGLPGAEIYERTLVAALMEKADKFFQFFSSVEDAKKTIQFLQTVNPAKAKEIIEDM